MSGAFDIFPKGLIDTACDRVKYLLAHEPILREWATGGVYRTKTLGPVPGVALPYIVVSGLSVRSETRPGAQFMQLLDVAILLTWEEYESIAEDGENSVASAVALIARTLYGKPYLDVPECGGDRVAERLDSLQPTSLVRVAAEEDSKTVLSLQVTATYEIATDLRTWTRFASPTT